MQVSKIQKQFWLLHDLFPECSVYNIWEAYKLEGKLNFSILQESVNEVVNRHEILRTVYNFTDGDVFQQVLESGKFQYSVGREEISLSEGFIGIPPEVESELNAPFDLKSSPPFRIKVFECIENDNSFLTLNFHHIMTDVRTNGIIIGEICDIYNAKRKNTELKNIIPYQYSDYIKFFKDWSSTDDYKTRLKSWLADYPDPSERIELPADFIRPKVRNQDGTCRLFNISDQLYSNLKKFEKKTSKNVFRILLASYALFLYRLSNQDKIIIGVPLTNRTQSVSRSTPGSFVNTLPLQVNFTDSISFFEIINQVDIELRKNLGRQDIPLIDILAKSETRGIDYNPFYQTGFTFRRPIPLEIEGINAEHLNVIRNGSQLDLFFILWEEQGQISGFAEYNTSLFKDETIGRWIKLFKKILDNCIHSPAIPVNEIDILPASDKVLLDTWNNTFDTYSNDLCIHQKLEEQVILTPEAMAVQSDKVSLNYAEFNRHVNRLAHYLIFRDIKKEDIIAVCMDRSVEMMIAIYAILKAGAVYLPVDPEYPEDRIKIMLDDSGTVLVFTLKESDKNLVNLEIQPLYLDDVLSTPFTEIDDNPKIDVNPRNLAYIIYTSGSTGLPKGVMIEHHSVLNRIEWMQKKYPLDRGDTLLQKTPIIFDVSIWELFWWSFTGSSLVMLPPGGEKVPGQLIDYIVKYNITVIHFVPSMFSAFQSHLDFNNKSRQISGLKRIFLSGEALPPKAVNDFYALMQNYDAPQLVNLYGPTEATVDVSYFNCPSTGKVETVYIGKPISNTQLLVINKRNKIQPIGIPGELVIAGVNLARGYLNREALNQERFTEIESTNGEFIRVYKTGDLVKWTDIGELLFLGRIDHQVKIKGFRIELGEIESRLLDHANIENAAVIPHSGSKLIAFLKLKNVQSVNTDDIRIFLAKKLPQYMVPAHYIIRAEMPITASGKVDRKRLKYNPADLFVEEEIKRSNFSEKEKQLVAIWKDVLGFEVINRDQSFFDIGGDSLLAIRLSDLLSGAYGFTISPVVLYQYPTIGDFISFLNQKENDKSDFDKGNDANIRKQSFSFRNRRR